jgi:DNA invertase Pin-like site-specific DNA recombinase
MGNNSPERGKRAYSYLRFSTAEQAKGDSFRRQNDMAVAYASEHGLVLDTELTFHDLGVSGFRGQNASVGQLGYFREAVRHGLVPPGSFLLVESLDRISRNDVFDAQGLLTDIVREGVAVVTLLDKRVYSLETLRAEPMGMVYAVMLFMRANEESATKSRRLSASWEAKRSRASSNKPLTGISPAWVRVSLADGTIELIPERADIVRSIFSMTLEGVGQHSIAQQFNREGLPTWGRAKLWHRSYISKILGSRAVVGTIIPHLMDYTGGRKARRALQPIAAYYPAVVSDETFEDVQALSFGKRAPGRTTSAGAPLANVLASMARCPECEGTMTRVQKGKRSHPSLVCAKAKAGAGCHYRSVRYEFIESAILERLAERLVDIPAGAKEVVDYERAILTVSEAQDALREQARNLVDNLTYGTSPTIVAALREVEGKLAAGNVSLFDLISRRDATSGALIRARVDRVIAALQPSETLDRAALNAALRGVFSSAVINWTDGTVDFQWIHGGGTCLPYALPQ